MQIRQIAIFLIALLAIQAFIGTISVDSSHAQTTPDVYVGVDLAYGDVAEAKALIDKVSSYTNLIVVGTSKITWYPDKLMETFQYAYDKGLSFISLTPNIPTSIRNVTGISSFNRTEWFKYAKAHWGDRLLGFYQNDEPGGKTLDNVHPLVGNQTTVIGSYAEAASQFVSRNNLTYVRTQNLASSGYPLLTSDYALYWFDYKAGYDAIFAELGWNYSRQINIALCRGAATLQNKDWCAVITWTNTTPPYIESGEKLYDDLVLSYDNGAKYIMVFDANEGYTSSILQQEHLDALQKFWNYVQNNPRQSNPISERTAYVLPEAYGYGFRGPNDHIWGIWGADSLTLNITTSVASLLDDYGEKLDVIYDDGLQPGNNYGYKQLVYWDSYSLPPPKISVLSPQNKTYAENNVTLTFETNEPVTWIGYSLDNQAQVTITDNITLTNLPEGPHNITVYAKDEYGSLGKSETTTFNVDLPAPPEPSEPFPTTFAIAAVLFSVAVCAGMVAFFMKRKR